MVHIGMAKMFKSLEDTGLKGFLEASDLVYEGAVIEFFANATVIARTIVSFVGNQKMVLTKEVFTEAFGLPTEGLTSSLDMPKDTMVEMQHRFSGSYEPFRASIKKKGTKFEYRLLHDIVAKALCAKAGSCDVVMSEKFDLMVAITVGLKMNWAKLVKDDLGESVKLHPQKLLTNKSVHTFIKKNHDVKPIDESTKEGCTVDNHEVNLDTTPVVETQADNTTNTAEIEERVGCESQAKDEGPNDNVFTFAQGDPAQDREVSSQANPQQVNATSPPATPNVDIRLKAVEQVVVSLDSRVQSVDSRVQSMNFQGYIDPSIHNPDPSWVLKGYTVRQP
ncbi:hypothetical protein F511_37806 [Dorcoceras hygrometricum]|uniref:Uncharacterized protein n=1 Tax=Dorcoceras hygrometricum TaxID=472368 RepID=A0A2Z7CDK2_9LAMI|nr:hypothetical protein F511_37806 [Dorcoceras hygrometricum]